MSNGLRRALKSLWRSGAKLLLTHNGSRQSGRAFAILPQGDHVAEETVQGSSSALTSASVTGGCFLIGRSRGC